MNLSLLYYYLCNNHFLISIIVYHTAMALCELGGKPFSVSNIFRLFEEKVKTSIIILKKLIIDLSFHNY